MGRETRSENCVIKVAVLIVYVGIPKFKLVEFKLDLEKGN